MRHLGQCAMTLRRMFPFSQEAVQLYIPLQSPPTMSVYSICAGNTAPRAPDQGHTALVATTCSGLGQVLCCQKFSGPLNPYERTQRHCVRQASSGLFPTVLCHTGWIYFCLVAHVSKSVTILVFIKSSEHNVRSVAFHSHAAAWPALGQDTA